jgi:hypothetical protein
MELNAFSKSTKQLSAYKYRSSLVLITKLEPRTSHDSTANTSPKLRPLRLVRVRERI